MDVVGNKMPDPKHEHTAGNAGAIASRLIVTLAGSQYGLLDTPVTFTGDFAVDVEYSSTETSVVVMAVFGYSISGATNFLGLEDALGGAKFSTPDGSVTWASHGNIHRDGKIHTITAYREGLTIGIKLDGVIKASTALGAASTVDIDLMGCLGITTVPFYFLEGQMLSVKFIDQSGASDIVIEYVLDNGSTTEQYARGSITDRVGFINFAADDWSRHTLQKNILHDAGVIAEAWVGDTIVVNGRFGADTDWVKGDGWSISGGVASCDGSQVAATFLAQIVAHIIDDFYFVTYDVPGYTVGAITVILGGVFGTPRGAAGAYKQVLKPITAGALGLQGDTAFTGTADNVSVQHLLEIA